MTAFGHAFLLELSEKQEPRPDPEQSGRNKQTEPLAANCCNRKGTPFPPTSRPLQSFTYSRFFRIS